MSKLHDKLKGMFPQVQTEYDTSYGEYFYDIVADRIKKKYPELSTAVISKSMVEKVLLEMKEDNQATMKALGGEYEQVQGRNKYVDDGIWMDIGGCATVNETIDGLLAVN